MVEIIETLDAVDFRLAIRSRVLDPIGLDSFLLGPTPEVQAQYDFCDISVRDDAERYGGGSENPGLLSWNSESKRGLGVPGGGGWTTAADLALLLQPVLHGGETVSGESLVSPETIELATTQKTDGRHARMLTESPTVTLQVRRGLVVELAGDDEVIVPTVAQGIQDATFHTDKVEMASMAGQHIPAKIMRQAGFGLTNSAGAFGHDGVGGKFVWADPETGISFAFVTNTFSSKGACLIRSMELSTLANATLAANAAARPSL